MPADSPIPSSALDAEARAQEERRKARANWPVRIGTLKELESDDWTFGFEPDEVDAETEERYLRMTPEERTAEIWRLTKEAWFRQIGIRLED